MNEMLMAQLNQARTVAQNALKDKEMYARLCVCLSRYITTAAKVPMMGGNVCVPKTDFDAVPKMWGIEIRGAKLANADDVDPNAVEEEMVVVVVAPRPEPSLIVKPNGRV